MDASTIQLVLEKVFEYGLFGALFVLLLVAVGFAIWKIGSKISDKTIETLTSISATNVKYAESSMKMVELVEVLTDQTKSTLDQLKYIKAHLKKMDCAAIELMNIVKAIPKHVNPDKDNSEISIRIENVIKELQRPLE